MAKARAAYFQTSCSRSAAAAAAVRRDAGMGVSHWEKSRSKNSQSGSSTPAIARMPKTYVAAAFRSDAVATPVSSTAAASATRLRRSISSLPMPPAAPGPSLASLLLLLLLKPSLRRGTRNEKRELLGRRLAGRYGLLLTPPACSVSLFLCRA
jgi:hypothetical protein